MDSTLTVQPPSTPQKNAAPSRQLWSSPSDSSYFSGDDASITLSPESVGARKDSTGWTEGLSRGHAMNHDSVALSDPYTHPRSMSYPSDGVQPQRCTQTQQSLVGRLNTMASAIILASDDFIEHLSHDLEADIDKMEQTLAAPDSQTRTPADGDEMGLFEDLDESTARDTIERINKLSVSFKLRFREMQVGSIRSIRQWAIEKLLTEATARQ
jgi:hypothetical protein